jgi:hypothetical protein
MCAACCGSKRGSEIQCSDDCEFYPFGVAGYGLWLKIDEAIMPKLVRRVVEEFGQDHVENLIDSLSYTRMGEDVTGDFSAYSALQICLSVERDKTGRTLAERWAAEGWAGLKRDEALMMGCRSRSFVTVFEIQRVLDHQRVECIDLFSENLAPFVIVDRSLARGAVRFSRLFGWLTHYPHFSRPGLACFIIPQTIRREFMAMILGLTRREGQDAGGGDLRREKPNEAAVKQSILEHLADLIEALAELPEAKMRSMWKGMDVWHCQGFYRLTCSQDEVIRILDSKPDFEWVDQEPAEGDAPGMEHYHWRRLGESQEFEKTMPGVFRHGPGDPVVGSLGHLTVSRGEMVFETFAKAKYKFGKKMIEKYLGRMVTLESETAVDLARRVAEECQDEGGSAVSGILDDTEAGRVSSIPPEVEAQALREYLLSHYAKFMDDAVPALGGLTPRQASRDSEARPLLVELMKEHIFGIERDNRDRGIGLDIGLVLKELGLDELL